MYKNIKKSFIWNTLGSGLNSCNSLFFLIIVTRINGIKDAGIFTLSYATACLLYVLATYSGRTYQVTETDNKMGDNEFIIHRFITSFIMIIISIIFGLIMGYRGYKFIIFFLLCLLKCCEAISDVFHGILQKNNRLDIVGISLFTRSLIGIISFIVIDFLTKNMILSCISIVIIDIIAMLIIDIRYALKYKEKKKNINYKMVTKIFTLGFFTFGLTLISNYLINASRYAIDRIMTEEYQTIFGIIIMPATVIVLLNSFIIQPVITTLKADYVEGNKNHFLKLTIKIITFTFLIGVFCVIVAYFLGIPVLNMLYSLKLNDYRIHLLLVLIGSTLYTISTVLSNALIVLRKTKIQLAIYVFVSIVAFILSNKLVVTLGFSGAIYNYVLIMLILLLLYIGYFLITIRKKESWMNK